MSKTTVGLIWAFSFVILEAAQAVFFGGVFQDYDSFLIGAAVFGISAVGTLIWSGSRTPDQLRIAWSNKTSLIGLNLSTAFVWVAYFYALQMIEPAVVFTIFSGLIPIAILIAAACRVPEASPLRNFIEGLGIVIVLMDRRIDRHRPYVCFWRQPCRYDDLQPAARPAWCRTCGTIRAAVPDLCPRCFLRRLDGIGRKGAD